MSVQPPRKGVADIEPTRLALLNAGSIEAATLTECLAVDFAQLMQAACPEIGAHVLQAMRTAAGEGISRRMALAARLIHGAQGQAGIDNLGRHSSDTVRGWACFAIGLSNGLSLSERLAAIRRFADDPHFGVREWAWLAVRPHIAAELEPAIEMLVPWAAEPSERLRRFASEATRPRGVWCAHLTVLRRSPELALPILDPLRSDPAVYVQDSVGNWLNDASKDRPDWVRGVCTRWQAGSATSATARICKRGLRTLNAKA